MEPTLDKTIESGRTTPLIIKGSQYHGYANGKYDDRLVTFSPMGDKMIFTRKTGNKLEGYGITQKLYSGRLRERRMGKCETTPIQL